MNEDNKDYFSEEELKDLEIYDDIHKNEKLGKSKKGGYKNKYKKGGKYRSIKLTKTSK